MSSCETQSRENVDCDGQNFSSVVTNEFSRNRGFPQPPDQYSDYSSKNGGDTSILGVAEEVCSSEGYKTMSESNNSQWDRNGDCSQTSQGIKVCVYLMTDVVFLMELSDGQNTTVADMVQSIVSDETLGFSSSVSSFFTLWICSGLLELQLKPHHQPLAVKEKWPTLLSRYAHATESRQRRDEPVLSFQRNVFVNRTKDHRVKDPKLLELLYHEAKYNVLEGRYPCEVNHFIMLGSIQARLELGPYNPQLHTIQFFRDHQNKFFPIHMRRGIWTSWLRFSGKNSPEVKLIEQYQRLSQNIPERKLQRKYLEFCWSLPYYGCAFFQGQIEQPVRGLTSLITHQDIPVLVGINTQGVFVIDNVNCCLLLGLKYEEMSWDFANPSQQDNPDCLPCLFLLFRVLENGTRVAKILQVFSKQAKLMDTLIAAFVDEIKQKGNNSGSNLNSDETDRPTEAATDSDDTHIPLTKKDLPHAFFGNKLSKLTLATFDDEVDMHEIGIIYYNSCRPGVVCR